jgi:undecaprenyl-diphosphatase
MNFICNNDLIKGGIVVSLLWFFWFRPCENILEKRSKIINALVSCLLAIFIGRLLARLLSFRQRPVLNLDLVSFFPNPHIAEGLDFNSSMPSDHAVMFFALATGIFLISKKAGLITFIYTSCFILFPRIYLGYHFATDIITGGIVGILIPLVYSFNSISAVINKKIMDFSVKYTGVFFLLFFLLSFQIGTMFDSSREIAHYLAKFILSLNLFSL